MMTKEEFLEKWLGWLEDITLQEDLKRDLDRFEEFTADMAKGP